MATTLDAQIKEANAAVSDARAGVRLEFIDGQNKAKQIGLTGGKAANYARQLPGYKNAQAELQAATDRRNSLEAARNAQTGATAYGTTTQYTTFDENGDAASVTTRTNVSGQPQAVSQTAYEPATPVPAAYSAPTYSAPQSSTAEQPIPFISDETYLDPLYEPAPTSPTVAKLPTSPYDINQDGTVSDSEYLYGDDELYEPVPTDAELASLQEQLDEDAEFAAIDDQFARIDAINDPAIFTAEEANYALSGQEFADFDANDIAPQPAPPAAPRPASPPKDLSQYRQLDKNDWRFRLRLSPFADYLYNAPNPGILGPLKATDGVIFPYTPQITMAQSATYNTYNPTHSNFRGHFYQGSQQGDILINGTFTAQDPAEANYMLAMMHFFRAASKMFYGQDQRRGTPPPLLYMNGLGEYNFNEHPVVIQSFNYTLPDNVDYISTDNSATGYTPQGRSDGASAASSSSWARKIQAGIVDAIFGSVFNSVTGSLGLGDFGGVTKMSGGKTYVPTSLTIQLNLLPVNTREQVSNFYSLEDFASGNLLKKGYW